MVKPCGALHRRITQTKLVKCLPAIRCQLNAAGRGCCWRGPAKRHIMTGIGGCQSGAEPGDAMTTDHDCHLLRPRRFSKKQCSIKKRSPYPMRRVR